MIVDAEIISIGDEITSGQTLDTNSQWLSRQLEDLGITVLYHTTVADQLAENLTVFRLALERADVVVATGGLGPTADDLTRQALAETIGRPLVLDARALEQVRAIFARRKRPMPAQNEVQAYLPEGSRMIDNPHGTAPGIFLEHPRDGRVPCRLFALPGVPAEMREMWEQSVAPALRAAGAGQRVIVRKNFKCFGAGESQLEAMLPDLIRRGRTPTVGITASQATIILRIAAAGASREECEQLIAPVEATIRECLGTLVFACGDEELQDVVLRQLAAQGRTLTTLEWGTGGLLAGWFHAATAAPERYRGGLVLTPGSVPEDVLGLETPWPTTPEQAGPLVQDAAEAWRAQTAADVCLAVGPLPPGDPEQDGPRPIFFALATADQTLVKSVPYAGHPDLRKTLVAKQALNFARLALLG
jgi:nicotinamide-nucleotide amidase